MVCIICEYWNPEVEQYGNSILQRYIAHLIDENNLYNFMNPTTIQTWRRSVSLFSIEVCTNVNLLRYPLSPKRTTTSE